jgi:hypothetical protein
MKRFISIIIVVIALSVSVLAEEGMWLITQFKDLNLQKKGLKISVDDIYNRDKPCLADAIVNLGGGTAEFVSPEGLILTNHHVAFGAVQRASTQGTDYLTNGFLAKTRADEIQAPGYSAYVLQEMKDVTDEILAVGEGIEDLVEREKAINTKIQEMTDKIEEGKEDISARVASMYNGKQYILFVSKRFDDVRVVYVPPMSIGNYGDDIDNWMWPRHTGDFSFLRVYMAPDGTGRKYHNDNIPYKPKKWLKIASDHLKDGDFTFILGYPGRTTRFRTSNSVQWNLKYNYPESIKNYKEVIDLLQELTKDNPDATIKVTNLDKGLNNAMKNYQGKVDGMTKTNFVQNRKDFEKELMDFINVDKKLKNKYGDILDKISAEYVKLEEYRVHNNVLGNFGFLAGMLSSLANQIYNISKEREKPDSERDPNFSERDVERTVKRLEYRFYSYYEPVDKALLKRALNKAKDVVEESRVKGLDYILKYEDIETYVEDAYQKTKLNDVEFAKTLFSKSSKELEDLNDPLIEMAKNLYSEREASRKRGEKFYATITNLRKRYIDALYAWKGKGLYPDANGTLRFTYGKVEGYKPADAVWYYPFTTLCGVIEKDTGEEPFDVPEGLKALYEKKDYETWVDPDLGDVPVAFINHCDITGGNSGSPVLNAKGELVGIAFDGNYEAMTSDWQYDHDLQRAISVDIRYVMFVTEKFGKADHILKEMGVK